MSEASTRKRRLPKYRHHKPSNRAVVWINGRDYCLGRYGSPESHEKYARLIQEWKSSRYRLSPSPEAEAPPELVVTELLARFWIHAERVYRTRGRFPERGGRQLPPRNATAARPLRFHAGTGVWSEEVEARARQWGGVEPASTGRSRASNTSSPGASRRS